MIQDRTIICVASAWDQDPTSKHHIMRLLSRNNRVLWVNYHGTRRPTISADDARSAGAALSRVLQGPERISPNMVQMTPLVIPAAGTGWMGRLSQRGAINQIRKALVVLDPPPSQPVQIWSFAPDAGFLADQFNEELFLYYCVDEFSEFEGFDAEIVAAAEERLLRHADVVITSSEPLRHSKSARHADVHLVRHGVEHAHFAAALTGRLASPTDIADLPRPIVGFFGLLHHWIDVDLIAQTAQRLPEVSFVLIGQVFTDIGPLASMPNVRLLGRKPYAELPNYCSQFDAAILPFKCNRMTRFVNPIKLREYLAAGLPVVSTAIPEAGVDGLDVRVAHDGESFALACEQAIQADTAEARQIRSRSVSTSTWESTLARISQIVESKTDGRIETSPPLTAVNSLKVATTPRQRITGLARGRATAR